MKFTVTLKDPDGFSEGFREAAQKSAAEVPGLDKAEREAIEESRSEKVHDFAGKWVEYGEYVNLEFDTGAGTCVVVPRK